MWKKLFTIWKLKNENEKCIRETIYFIVIQRWASVPGFVFPCSCVPDILGTWARKFVYSYAGTWNAEK